MEDHDKLDVIIANFNCEDVWNNPSLENKSTKLKKNTALIHQRLSAHLKVLSGNECQIFSSWPNTNTNRKARILAWGETKAIESTRTHRAREEGPYTTWQEALWFTHSGSKIAQKVNHRQYSFDISHDNKWNIEGECRVDSYQGLCEAIKNESIQAAPSWVAKAPLASAGRHTLHCHGSIIPPDKETYTKNLLKRYGSLFVMPWLKRILDVSVAGIIAPKQTWLFRPHFTKVDKQGVVRSITVDDELHTALLTEEENAIIKTAARQVVQELRKDHYLGPFSIDGFIYQKDDKRIIRPLSEINARLSFGLVARAYSEKLKLDHYVFTI